MQARELTLSTFSAFHDSYWNKVYNNDHLSSSPLVFRSSVEFSKKQIPETPYWALYGKSFCERKPTLIPDFFKVPEEQKIGFCGPHLFMINAAPLCRYHSMFLPHFHDKLAQEISEPNQLLLSLNLLKEINAVGAKLVYNSSKAGASMNHLHFQLINTNELLGEGIHKLPIENCEQGTIIQKLVYKCTTKTYIVPHFVIKADTNTQDAYAKTAETAYKLIEAITKNGYPYNILVADNGLTVYIIPRKEVPPSKIGRGSLECAGVQICLDEKVFNEMGQKEVVAHLVSMRVEDEDLKLIESDFMKENSMN